MGEGFFVILEISLWVIFKTPRRVCELRGKSVKERGEVWVLSGNLGIIQTDAAATHFRFHAELEGYLCVGYDTSH